MPFTKFSNLDFDQIKTSIKDYLRANSDFTDFDYEGSNFSVLIDTLAYNTYITAFNANMVVNESFLDSAVLRENVVSLARNIGYVPRSRTAARAQVYFPINIDPTIYSTTSLTLKAGLVCVASSADEAFTFAISEDITTTVNNGVANFGTLTNPITVYQGTYINQSFKVDGSLDQRFLLENAFIDSSTIVVYVKGPSDTGMGKQYSLVDNIVGVNKDSETYLIQEVQDQKYELLFGDGVFGKKLEDSTEISVGYIISDGKAGNGPSKFTYAATIRDTLDNIIPPQSLPIINTTAPAANGGEIESIDSVKYFAPRLYSAQHRAVTGRDYEAIIGKVYPNTESVSVVGGEELDPPQFGTVLITIKPKNGEYVSDFDKQLILADLKNYSLAGINQKIVDLKLLYVELDSYVYFDTAKVSSVDRLKTRITDGLTVYSDSTDINKFGGRFKYSKALNIIDNIDTAITSNITRVKIRRNLKAILNSYAQYELCFGNKFNINAQGRNIKSTGFKIEGQIETVYITDIPNKDSNGNLDGSGKGVLSIVKLDVNVDEATVVVKSAGTVDYDKGEVMLTTTNITSTVAKNNIVEIQAFPDSNDVVGLKDLYLDFSISDTTINMVKDTITSGEKISGVGFKATSSYSNGDLIRT